MLIFWVDKAPICVYNAINTQNVVARCEGLRYIGDWCWRDAHAKAVVTIAPCLGICALRNKMLFAAII
jgi:hypothetical protein